MGKYTLQREEAKIETRVKEKQKKEKNIKKVDTSSVNIAEELILPIILSNDDSFSTVSEMSSGDEPESQPLNISVSAHDCSTTVNKAPNIGRVQIERRGSPRSSDRSYIRKPEARVRRSEMMKKHFNTYNTPKIKRNLSLQMLFDSPPKKPDLNMQDLSVLKSVTIFCTRGNDKELESEAHGLGVDLATKGFRVVVLGYGKVSEAIAQGVKTQNGECVAIISDKLFPSLECNVSLYSDSLQVNSLGERMDQMIKMSQYFIVLAGGLYPLNSMLCLLDFLTSCEDGKKLYAIAQPWEEVMNTLMNTLKLESRYKSKIIFVHDVIQATQKIVRHSNMITVKMKENDDKTKKKVNESLPKNWKDLF